MARTRGTARKAPDTTAVADTAVADTAVADAIARKIATDDEATEEEQQIIAEQQEGTEESTVSTPEAHVHEPAPTVAPAVDYAKMTVAALKKLLENRNIEGRSKLTTKGVIIKVLELFDQDPQDKAAISALVAEVSTPRKKKSEAEKTESSSSDAEEKKQKKSRSKKEPKDKKTESESDEKSKEPKEKSKEPKEKSKEPKEKSKEPKAEKASTKKKETKTSKKEKEDEEEDWLEKEGIFREDYPPGTRFVKSKMGKISVRYPKDSKTEASESEKSSEEKKKSKSKKNTKKTEEELEESDNVSLVEEEIKKDESSPSFLRYSEMNVENDPSMREMLELTRDVLRRMRSIANEAREDEKLKKSWINDLKELKKRFDHDLGMIGASVDDE